MQINDIKKLLYKQKPIAYLIKIQEGNHYYTAGLKQPRISLDFVIPENETKDSDGRPLFLEEEPAQLLIRWLKIDLDN